MIIGNIKRNEVIEARGYGSGYGCVHRIAVANALKVLLPTMICLNHYHADKTIQI